MSLFPSQSFFSASRNWFFSSRLSNLLLNFDFNNLNFLSVFLASTTQEFAILLFVFAVIIYLFLLFKF